MAIGDGVTDDTIAIQNTINDAISNGKNVYFPSGKYKTTSTLVIDNSSSVYFLDPKKINLFGDGIGLTQIFYTGTDSCLKIIGGKTGVGNAQMTYQTVRDLTIKGTQASGSKGIELDTCSFMHFSNVDVNVFDYGIFGIDTDNTSFTKVIIHWNLRGILLMEADPRIPLTSTRPNNTNFFDCHIGGNSEYGGQFLGGTCINFYGGDVEGNGISGVGAERYGLKFNLATQGGVSCNVNGTFFEANAGIGDVWVVGATSSSHGTNESLYNFTGCCFSRYSNVYAGTSNILASFLSSVAGQQKLVVTASSFKNFLGYTPSALTPHVRFDADVRSDTNCSISNIIQTDDAEKVSENKFMSISTSAAGEIGEYKEISAGVGEALLLPSGGTWEWSGFWVLNSTGALTYFSGVNAGIAAGGTTILAAHATYVPVARVRRIS